MTVLELIRRKKGVSQKQLGQTIGIHPTNITLVERGHRKAWPKLRGELAEALDLRIDELFDGNGNTLQA